MKVNLEIGEMVWGEGEYKDRIIQHFSLNGIEKAVYVPIVNAALASTVGKHLASVIGQQIIDEIEAEVQSNVSALFVSAAAEPRREISRTVI